MADFCKQCSLEIFGEDFGDLAGLIPEELVKTGVRVVALCEGCGPIQVDYEGRCISPDCLEQHGLKGPANG
jgi:hypothetical protein